MKHSLGIFWRHVWLVTRKDLMIELRTAEVLVTSLFFSLLITVLSSYAFLSPKDTAAGAIWVPLSFSSVMIVSRVWQREREESAWLSIWLSPVSKNSIFLGKTLVVSLILFVIESVLIPVVSLFFHLPLFQNTLLFNIALLMFLGTFGMAAIGTLFGVMMIRNQAKDLILASIFFPLLSPLLLTCIAGTAEALHQSSQAEMGDYFMLLAIFDTVSFSLGLGLFSKMVDDV